MFEEYKHKQVKLRIKINEETLTFTGTIKETSDTHIKFLDKFGKEHLFLITSIEQVTLQEGWE